VKRSNIDAMICKQEGITVLTREIINKIQLEKLNAVLKREKEREGFYRNLPASLESLDDLRTLPFNAFVFPGRSPESHLRTDKWNNGSRKTCILYGKRL